MYKSLLADPTCNVNAGTFDCRAVANTLAVHERQRRWEQVVRFWPDYASNQAKTTREIPVVKLAVESVSLLLDQASGKFA